MVATVAIPALVALVVKVALVAYAIKLLTRNTTTRVFLAVLIVVALQNLVEFVALNDFSGQVTPFTERLGFAYIALIILAAAAILHLSGRLSLDLPSMKAGWQLLLYFPAAVLLYLLLVTDQLVLGFQPFKNTVLRIPGPWYFLFESYFVLYLLAALALLVYGARESRPSGLARARNRLWLSALLPTGLLFTYLIIANHYGMAKLTSTFYAPITLTFFLIVAAYAIHARRLLDIAYFIPWSRARKRKTVFYRKIQALSLEINDLPSVTAILNSLANTLHCQVALIGGPRPLATGEHERQPSAAFAQLRLEDFPRAALQKVDHVIVAHEMADSASKLYTLMKRYKVGAIVPFNTSNPNSAHWLLLDEQFRDQVYTPLDFHMMEALFDKVAERFIDNLLILRSQLAGAQEQIRDHQRRLALAWDEVNGLQQKTVLAERHNTELRGEKAALRGERVKGAADSLPKDLLSGDKTLEQCLAEAEKEVILAALRRADGNKTKAARLLGVWSDKAFRHLLERHGLDREDCP